MHKVNRWLVFNPHNQPIGKLYTTKIGAILGLAAVYEHMEAAQKWAEYEKAGYVIREVTISWEE